MEIVFQQEGAPQYFNRQVRDYLVQQYSEGCIGRRGSIESLDRIFLNRLLSIQFTLHYMRQLNFEAEKSG